MKGSVILSAVFGWLLASGGGSLLAEKALFVLGVVLRQAGFHPAHYLAGLFSMQLMLCLFLAELKPKLHPGQRARIIQPT